MCVTHWRGRILPKPVTNASCSSVCTAMKRLVGLPLPICPINMLIICVGERAFAPSASTVLGVRQDVERLALASPVPDATKETLRLLKQAERQVWQTESRGRKVLGYWSPHLVDYFAIGRVQAFLPAVFDSCFIKVRLSEKQGVAKSFCTPPNLLRPSIAISTARHLSDWTSMPDKLTALSTLSRGQKSSRGEDSLMKMGAAIGLPCPRLRHTIIFFR